MFDHVDGWLWGHDHQANPCVLPRLDCQMVLLEIGSNFWLWDCNWLSSVLSSQSHSWWVISLSTWALQCISLPSFSAIFQPLPLPSFSLSQAASRWSCPALNVSLSLSLLPSPGHWGSPTDLYNLYNVNSLPVRRTFRPCHNTLALLHTCARVRPWRARVLTRAGPASEFRRGSEC